MSDDRRIYYSFHDIPASYKTSNSFNRTNRGFRFGSQELLQIFIAIAVLTIAFSFAFAPKPPLSHLSNVLSWIPVSFLAIITAFFCHELAHKYMGLKYGFHSEFRMYPTGLLIGLFLGIFTGFVFAAPGAVQIFGMPNREQTGKISLAGPLTNIIVALIFIGIFLVSSGMIENIAFIIAFINSFLAIFNLIPFGVLDGAKIMHWRADIWVLLLIIAGSIFIFLY